MTDVADGVAVVQSGRIAAGVRWIERAVNSYGEVNLFFPASAHLVLGEIFLELALRRQSAPPPRVLLRNLGFIMRNVLFAAGKARCHLEEALALARRLRNTFIVSRALLDLAELRAAKGHELEARQLLNEARGAVEDSRSPLLLERLTALTARLEGSSASARGTASSETELHRAN
jgi:hypothetical protein